MKMSSELFARFNSAIGQVCQEKIFPEKYAEIHPEYSAKRIRWNYLWAIPADIRQLLMDEAYAADLNDEHIDTALRQIVKVDAR